MAQVVVTIAGRTYRMNCEDGQEPHLQRLATEVDARMGDLKQNFGEIGDQRLVVMTALTIADELDSARGSNESLEAEAAAVRTDIDRLEAAAKSRASELEAVIETATARVNRLVDALNAAKS
jgi:cell division protein ZapA